MKKLVLSFALSLAAIGAFAATPGKITGIKVIPASPKPKEAFKVEIEGVSPVGGPCSITILFPGKAQTQLGLANSFPYTSDPEFTSAGWLRFDTPGNYQIQVKAGTGVNNNCTGSASVNVIVQNPPPPPQPVIVGANPNVNLLGNPCPSGWTGKQTASGEIDCHPVKPTTKLVCPPKTEYYETQCEVGCRKVIY